MSNTQNNEFNHADQITVTGRIEGNRAGGEVIKFPLHLGPFHIFCIVNVPGEGENEAPVYIKFRVGLDARPKKNRKNLLTHDDLRAEA